MRVVDFQEPIYPTIQGEGVLVGTPSVFVRLQGCEFRCEWCDTKESWNSFGGKVLSVENIVEKIQRVSFSKNSIKNYFNHVVITGGDPVRQANELQDLCAELRMRTNFHITVETQLYNPIYAVNINLLSISPKLEYQRFCGLSDIIENVFESVVSTPCSLQSKIVVSDLSQIETAISWNRSILETCIQYGVICAVYIQPEYSKGRSLVKAISNYLINERVGDMIILPQIHKVSLGVL